MPTTEIILPSLKQDPESQTSFHESLKPALTSIFTEDVGVRHLLFGEILTEDVTSNSVSSSRYKPILIGIEWEQPQNFFDFVSSTEFQSVRALVKPIAAAPSVIQLFDTDFSPMTAFSAEVTEVFRVELGEAATLPHVKGAWCGFVESMEREVKGGVQSLSGKSLNLEVEVFVGILGWENLEVRKRIMQVPAVKESKGNLDILGNVDSFMARFARK